MKRATRKFSTNARHRNTVFYFYGRMGITEYLNDPPTKPEGTRQLSIHKPHFSISECVDRREIQDNKYTLYLGTYTLFDRQETIPVIWKFFLQDRENWETSPRRPPEQRYCSHPCPQTILPAWLVTLSESKRRQNGKERKV